jgi:hypothetical protein
MSVQRQDTVSSGAAGQPGRDSALGLDQCPHCRRQLQVCRTCLGFYDTGRLCQQCMFGAVCPACQRYWTWT